MVKYYVIIFLVSVVAWLLKELLWQDKGIRVFGNYIILVSLALSALFPLLVTYVSLVTSLLLLFVVGLFVTWRLPRSVLSQPDSPVVTDDHTATGDTLVGVEAGENTVSQLDKVEETTTDLECITNSELAVTVVSTSNAIDEDMELEPLAVGLMEASSSRAEDERSESEECKSPLEVPVETAEETILGCSGQLPADTLLSSEEPSQEDIAGTEETGADEVVLLPVALTEISSNRAEDEWSQSADCESPLEVLVETAEHTLPAEERIALAADVLPGLEGDTDMESVSVSLEGLTLSELINRGFDAIEDADSFLALSCFETALQLTSDRDLGELLSSQIVQIQRSTQ